jgi:cyclophilin family peptidyl-prolyl cis-trans isomerase
MSVTIHTTAGDLKCEIFCDTCPRTAFNFLALAASGKYNGTIFHRNIRGFMMQGGDTHHVTGKKSSIWGDDVTFPDEFHPNNRHDRRGRLAMANRGPDTNKVSLEYYTCTSTVLYLSLLLSYLNIIPIIKHLYILYYIILYYILSLSSSYNIYTHKSLNFLLFMSNNRI